MDEAMTEVPPNQRYFASTSERDGDAMKLAIFLWRQHDLSSVASDDSVRNSKPTLGTPDLLDRLVDCCLLPSFPTNLVPSISILDLLNGEHDDVRAAYDKAIAQLLTALTNGIRMSP